MTTGRPIDIGRRVFLLGTAALAAGCFRAGPAGTLRIAAGDPGGLYLAFAEILAKQMKLRYPNIEVEVLPTEGTVENLRRLRTGDVDMGLALADVAERDRVTGPADQAPDAVARVYENYLQVIVREDAAIQQLSDLQAKLVSIGPKGSGAAATSKVLFEAVGLHIPVDMLHFRLRDGLARLGNGDIDALVWSGGVPTPAVAELAATVPLRMLDIGAASAPMSRLADYPYVVRRVPTCEYVPPGIRSIGVPDLLLCRRGIPADQVAAVVDVLVSDAPQLVPPYVRGLQYLDAPSMIQTGVIPLNSGAVGAYRRLHG